MVGMLEVMFTDLPPSDFYIHLFCPQIGIHTQQRFFPKGDLVKTG
jgi:hypothetical protein